MGASAALGLGSIASAGASLFGSNEAANATKKAAQIAAATQMAMFNQTQGYLAPYRSTGDAASAQLSNRLTDLTSPIVMDQATLQQTPGYQFNLAQGLRAAQASAAARGLGLSGAAIKGATDYATGLADSTYQNQFNNAVTNQTNAYNRLLQAASLGENAAAGTGAAATATGQGIANAYTGAGNTQAAAAMGGANAIGGAANSAAQYYALAPLLNKLTGLYGGGTNFDPLTGQKLD